MVVNVFYFLFLFCILWKCLNAGGKENGYEYFVFSVSFSFSVKVFKCREEDGCKSFVFLFCILYMYIFTFLGLYFVKVFKCKEEMNMVVNILYFCFFFCESVQMQGGRKMVVKVLAKSALRILCIKATICRKCNFLHDDDDDDGIL